MPKVDKSGIYRREDGHSLFLRKGSVVNEVVAEAYTLDPNAVLSDTRQAIVAAERSGEAVSIGEEVEALETDTVNFPNVIEPEVAAEPVPVSPSKRKRKPAEDRAVHTVETPEDNPVVENRDEDDDDDDE